MSPNPEGGGGRHNSINDSSRYQGNKTLRTHIRTDGRKDDVKKVYPPTNTVCGGIIIGNEIN